MNEKMIKLEFVNDVHKWTFICRKYFHKLKETNIGIPSWLRLCNMVGFQLQAIQLTHKLIEESEKRPKTQRCQARTDLSKTLIGAHCQEMFLQSTDCGDSIYTEILYFTGYDWK